MRQRKILDINSKLSAEALIDADGRVELNLHVGSKDYRVAGDEVRQLRDWLTKEVLNEKEMVWTSAKYPDSSKVAEPQPTQNGPRMPQAEVLFPGGTKITPSGIILPGGQPSAPGPLVVAPGTKVDVVPLDQRRAVTTQAKKKYNSAITSLPDVGVTHTGRKLDMEVQDMSGNIEQAKEAFAPQNLNQPEAM